MSLFAKKAQPLLSYIVKFGPDRTCYDLFKQLAILDARNGITETPVERNLSCAIYLYIQHVGSITVNVRVILSLANLGPCTITTYRPTCWRAY